MEFKTYDYSEIDSVVFELKNNKAVIIPTDTVIGVLANNENLIYQIKDRPKEKKIILFVANDKPLGELTPIQKEFVNKFWPGQVTIIKNGISYRMPDDKYLLYILSKTGPLYSSSANVSGHDTIKKTSDANNEFNVDKFYYSLVLVNGVTQKTTPSTVINIDTWEILREGCQIEAVKEFVDRVYSSRKQYGLLVDKDLLETAKVIKKEVDNNNVNIIINPLSIDSLQNLSESIRNKFIVDGFIVTNDVLSWDTEANKQELIRSAFIYTEELATLAKMHDNSNIAIFDSNQYSTKQIIDLMKVYIGTNFEGGRHEKRVQTIIDYELKNK